MTIECPLCWGTGIGQGDSDCWKCFGTGIAKPEGEQDDES